MRIHWLQHVPFEGLGSIEGGCQAQGHTLTATRFWQGDDLPPPYQVDGVIVMGGPMNIYEEDRYPWLVPEKRWLGEAIEQGRPTLGICLGAQLVADVLGGRVKPGEPEIGWMPVTLRDEAKRAPLTEGLPDTLTPLHWHGDTFSIPPQCVHLMSSPACANQAFHFEDFVLALQFHLESTPETVETMLTECAGELHDAPHIHTAETIRAATAQHAKAGQAVMGTLLERLFN